MHNVEKLPNIMYKRVKIIGKICVKWVKILVQMTFHTAQKMK